MSLPHRIEVIRRNEKGEPKALWVSADLITCPACNPDSRLDPKFPLEIVKNPSKLPHAVEIRD